MLIYIPYIQYTLSHLSRQTSVHHSPLNLVLSLHLLHNYGSGSQHTSYQYCSAPWKPRQDTCRLCYCELIFYATLVFHPSLSVFSSSFYLKFTTQFNTVMHAISHSLAQWAHRGAPPATRTRARWQPYNAIQPVSLPQVIFIPPHHLYHQHLRLRLKCSPYPKTIVFETLLLPHPLSLRPRGRYLFVMSRKANMSSVLLVSPSFELQRRFGRARGARVQYFSPDYFRPSSKIVMRHMAPSRHPERMHF
jgi:hypothetical protein